MFAVRVKYCGMTSRHDIDAAIRMGVDAIGLIFHPESPRAVTVEEAEKLLNPWPVWVNVVAVLVNPSHTYVEALLERFPMIGLQFHGQESPELCGSFHRPYIKAIPAHDSATIKAACHAYEAASALLLDTPSQAISGGTGMSFDWGCIPQDLPKPIILAGGLGVDNVANAIRTAHPYAVDVCSGIEQSKGIKDHRAMARFLEAVRQTE